MSFGNYRARYRDQSKVLAGFAFARGKRRFVLKVAPISGGVFWIGSNAVQFARHPEILKDAFLAGREGAILVMSIEVALLLMSMLFGLLMSLTMWSSYKRIAESE